VPAGPGKTGPLIAALGILAVLVMPACGGDGDSADTGANGPSGAGDATGANGSGRIGDSAPRVVADPIATVERFYRLLNSGQYNEAWAILPLAVQAEAGGFDQWKAGYAATISSDPRDLTVVSQGGGTAAVSLTLEAADRDACSGNRVEQVFAGTWNLRRAGSTWEAEAIDFAKVSGATPTLDAAECGAPPPASEPPPTEDCTPGYSPCLTPASDYDCEGGEGDGPEYVAGPVQVTGSDPYGLDLDSNGVGCE
jgi:hypothetical protein